jgi:hypothetical protein
MKAKVTFKPAITNKYFRSCVGYVKDKWWHARVFVVGVGTTDEEAWDDFVKEARIKFSQWTDTREINL